MIAACTCWALLSRSGPVGRRLWFPPQARDHVRRQVHAGRAGQVRCRVFERQGKLQLRAERQGVANLGLAEERDRIQPLEIDADGLGFRV